ncbi:13821_t:CDS:2, partial [Gigaspora rosea]
MQITFNYSTITEIQNAIKINCPNIHICIYHGIEFLKLMEKPFMQLVNHYDSFQTDVYRKRGKHLKELMLDSLPFGIFSKLLQLFKPLEHITCRYDRNISMEEYICLVDKIVNNANNMLREFQFSDNLGHKILKSFLRSIPLYFECKDLYAEQLALFLDPRSKPDEISTVNNLDKSLQAANKELECYINRPQPFLDGDISPYEWWQGSKQMLPGLAVLAREYLPTLTVDKEDPAKNLGEFIKIYDNDMADK